MAGVASSRSFLDSVTFLVVGVVDFEVDFSIVWFFLGCHCCCRHCLSVTRELFISFGEEDSCLVAGAYYSLSMIRISVTFFFDKSNILKSAKGAQPKVHRKYTRESLRKRR